MLEKLVGSFRVKVLTLMFGIAFAFAYLSNDGLFTRGLAIFFLACFAASFFEQGFIFFAFPFALVFQELLPSSLKVLPMSLNTFLMGMTIFFAFMYASKFELKLPKTKMRTFVIAWLILLFFLTFIHGLPVSTSNYRMMHFLETGVMFLAVSRFLTKERRIKLFSWLIVIFFTIITVKLFTYSSFFEQAFFGFENNGLSREFAFVIPFTLGLFWAEKNKYLRFLLLIALAFMGQTILQLGSRATYLSLFIAMVLMSLKNVRKKSLWGFAGLAIIMFLYFAPGQLEEEVNSIFTSGLAGTESTSKADSARWEILFEGIDAFIDSPIIGYGPGIFEKAMKERTGRGMNGHNTYVEIMVCWGIGGIFLYISFFILSIYYFYIAAKMSGKGSYMYELCWGGLFGIIAIGLNQAMINGPWDPLLWIAFTLAVSSYYTVYFINKENVKENKSQVNRS
ncbi:O-antigen ligase family protein [Candidatus Woesearchaeota archaeon]|nr:O-antigen ligase family protein [Candidatus Woesearchaeota archaeon]